jgi:hypothetical protein
MNIKGSLKRFLPADWLETYRRVQRAREKKRNAAKTTEQVFTQIYAEKKWTAGAGEFDSGAGSSDERVANAYVSAVRDWLSRIGSTNLTIVDLGCGDFRVGRQFLDLCHNYIGIDVVKPLIDHLVEKFASSKVEFLHRNILEDGLPNGDICFLRQVLQHLSNNEIQTILRQVQKYRWVVITEHHPLEQFFRAPNLDKPHGADIRLFDGSGVFLEEPPFNVPRNRLELLLEIAGHPFPAWPDPGVIRTYLVAGP